MLLRLILIIRCLLEQILHIIIDYYIFGSLDLLGVFWLVMIDLVGFFFVYYGVLECHFSIFFRPKKFLFKNNLKVGLFEVAQIVLVFRIKELLLIVGDLQINYMQDGVVESHAERQVILAQSLRYIYFLTHLNLLNKQEFGES